MKKQSSNKQYFTKETEDAILRYNQSTSSFERNEIYNNEIQVPFDKLVESIINRFKLDSYAISYEEVKHDTISYLTERLYKYTDPTLGKAYSYFSMVCKNHLIGQNDIKYKRKKLTDTVDHIDIERNTTNEMSTEYTISDKSEFINLYVEYVDKNLTILFRSPADQDVADSVLELFRIRDNIDCFNKKNLYILIRERTGANTTTITKVVNRMKKLYSKLNKIYLNTRALNVKQGKYNKSLII